MIQKSYIGGIDLKKKWISILAVSLACFLTGCSQNSGQTAGSFTPENGWPKILDTAVAVDESGVLNYVPSEAIETQQMQEIWIFQDQLLTASSTYDFEEGMEHLSLRLSSMDEDKILHEAELTTAGSYAVTVQACDDEIVVSDAENSKIWVFDENLEPVTEYEVSGEQIYVNTSVTEAYGLTKDAGIQIYDLETGKVRVVLENTSDLTLYNSSDDYLSIQYIDLMTPDKKECYAGLDLKTGEIEKLEIDDSFSGMEYHAGIWAAELLSQQDSYFVGTQADPYKLHAAHTYNIIRLAGNPTQLIFYLSEADGSQKMEAYGMDGNFLSACSTKGLNGMMTLKVVWSEAANGYFFLMIDGNGYNKLYFWDFSKEANGEDLDLISYYTEEVLGGEILDQSYYDRAAALSEKYGATIKIADQCLTDYGDKVVKLETDPEKVEAGLLVLEQTLGNYPDGFFGQLYYGGIRRMEINLVGEIENKEAIEGHSPSAFVQAEGGKTVMVLNICADASLLEQNFYHETSHIIDKVLEHDAFYREDALYSEEDWWSLNPKAFYELNPEAGGYYNSYEIMPMEYYQEAFVDCFAYDYGKTYATEDRATVFETAMMGNYQRFSPAVSQTLHDKLEYYSQCIRDCFDTTGWPEYTTWEETLRKSESYQP